MRPTAGTEAGRYITNPQFMRALPVACISLSDSATSAL
jgi:hypothetical protein